MASATYRNTMLTLLAGLSSPLLAADIETVLPITAATVHPESAVLTRSRTIPLPAGEHRLIIQNLPSDLDPARLILSIASNQVKLGSIEIEEATSGALASQAELNLQQEVLALEDSRKAITDTIDAANTQLAFITSLASGGSDASVKPSVDSGELNNLVTGMGTGFSTARARIREAEIALRELDQALAAKRFELAQVATSRTVYSTVSAQLEVAAAVETAVTLSYPEENAGWTWLYEARLDTETRSLALQRQAVIEQYSGEAWTDVELTLTTADPAENNATPEPESVFVYLEEPVAFAAQAKSAGFDGEMLEEVVVTGSRIIRSPAEIIASQYLVEYRIPGKISIDANQEEKIVYVDAHEFVVQLVTRSVPIMEELAYLEARFNYTGTIPLQAADVQLYRDGAFIGDNYMDAMLPNQMVRLPFGVDERVLIQVRYEEEATRSASALRRNDFEDNRVRFEISSFHSSPVDIEVLSQVPVSRNDQINVEIAEDATPATETDYDGKAGLLLWKFQAAQGETRNIKHYFSISYPKDSVLGYEGAMY